MRKTYSEFCSRHTKALKLYKELYARDKRFQQFIRVSKPLQDPHSASCSGPNPAPQFMGACVCTAPQVDQVFTSPVDRSFMEPLMAVEQELFTAQSDCPYSRSVALYPHFPDALI